MLNSRETEGSSGLQFTSLAWLEDHHNAKLEYRAKMVDSLPLLEGHNVLDIGCGPGFWAPLFKQKIGRTGTYLGVDFSTELIDYAVHTYIDNSAMEGVSFQQCDFFNLQIKRAQFDCIFIGGCIAYIEHQREEFLKYLSLFAKPGGLLICKEFDGGHRIHFPIDPIISNRIFYIAAKNASASSGTRYLDNFVGRKMHKLFLDSGLNNVHTTIHPFMLTAPLTDVAKRYIQGDVQFYVENAAAIEDGSWIEEWASYFDPMSERYALDRPDYTYSSVEFVTVGSVSKVAR